MIKGIQQPPGISDERSLIAAALAARQAGFEAFEPILGEAGTVAVGTDEPGLRSVGEHIRDLGLAIPSLACNLFERTPLSTGEASTQQQARDLLLVGLDRATWLGAKLLVVQAGRITAVDDARRQCTRYADALNALHAILEVTVPEAEVRGVVICIKTPADAFLLSPVEMRDLVDAAATPWLQVCIDTGALQRHGFPADWIETLGPRIGTIHASDQHGDRACRLGEGDVDWPHVVAATKRIHYAGPVICVSTGEPVDSMSRLTDMGL